MSKSYSIGNRWWEFWRFQIIRVIQSQFSSIYQVWLVLFWICWLFVKRWVKREKERKKCDLNENENDVLDLPSLEIVTFGTWSFRYCYIAEFESMWWLFIFIFISFLILDLPKLHTISFNGDYVLQGDYRDNRKTIINGHRSYDNTLIMKSKLKWNEMWIVFWW